MSFKLSFTNPEFEPYTALMDEEDVYAAIKEEAEKIVTEGHYYDEIWEDGVEGVPSPEGYDERVWQQMCHDADIRGIEQATAALAVEAKDAVWNMELDEKPQRYKFPDGTTIILSIEED